MKWRRCLDARRAIAHVAAIVVLLSAVSCKEADAGKALAQQGAAAADAMATYYDQLAQDRLDTMELEAFMSAVRNTPFDRDSQALYEKEHEALERRAAMAHSLAATYKAFGDLSSYDASSEIDASAQKLGQSLKALPGLPGVISDPGTILAGAADKIAEWRQGRDIRKANELMIEILKSLQKVYGRELDVYKSLAEERGNKAANVASFLIKDKRLDAKVLLEGVPKSIGLQWSAGAAAPSDEMLAGLATIAAVKQRRLALASVQAGDDLKLSLDLLQAAHEKFKTEHRPPLDEVSRTIEKVKSALDSIVEGRAKP